MRKLRPRHFFSWPALLGAALAAYNVLLASIQIGPLTHSDLKWGLFAIGMALSLGAWVSLAYAAARDENEG